MSYRDPDVGYYEGGDGDYPFYYDEDYGCGYEYGEEGAAGGVNYGTGNDDAYYDDRFGHGSYTPTELTEDPFEEIAQQPPSQQRSSWKDRVKREEGESGPRPRRSPPQPTESSDATTTDSAVFVVKPYRRDEGVSEDRDKKRQRASNRKPPLKESRRPTPNRAARKVAERKEREKNSRMEDSKLASVRQVKDALLALLNTQRTSANLLDKLRQHDDAREARLMEAELRQREAEVQFLREEMQRREWAGRKELEDQKQLWREAHDLLALQSAKLLSDPTAVRDSSKSQPRLVEAYQQPPPPSAGQKFITVNVGPASPPTSSPPPSAKGPRVTRMPVSIERTEGGPTPARQPSRAQVSAYTSPFQQANPPKPARQQRATSPPLLQSPPARRALGLKPIGKYESVVI